MKRSTKVLVAILAAVAIASVGVYAVLTSSSGGNPCAGVVTPAVNAAASPARAAGPLTTTTEPYAPPRASTATTPVVASTHPRGAPAPIQVVAGENFWGSLVSQLGGGNVSVVSIVSDPNTDPHEYEANASTAIAIKQAQYVIVNGVGYDQWALGLIASDGTSNQTVLNVGDINHVVLGGGVVSGNPHMWYNPVYVNRTLAAMYSNLTAIQPSSRTSFQANYASLNVSLAQLYGQAGIIKQRFAGTVVAATEDIFVYLANYTGLDLVSPPAFMQAVAEGSDPPAASIVEFQCQLESGKVSVLVYNQQTVTPTTISMKTLAVEHNVTIVGVTETIQPPDVTFQAWMGAEYIALQNALNANALGH